MLSNRTVVINVYDIYSFEDYLALEEYEEVSEDSNQLIISIKSPHRQVAEIYTLYISGIISELHGFSKALPAFNHFHYYNIACWLAEFFDNRVSQFIKKDLQIMGPAFKNLEGNDITKLAAYFKYGAEQSHSNFDKYISLKYPEMPKMLSLLSRQLIDAFKKAFNRISNDFELICAMSFDTPEYFVFTEECSVKTITPTGSDLHKEGQQVLIVTLTNLIKEVKIVYKPSSVLADMMLMGNTDWYNELRMNDSAEAVSSIAERLNIFTAPNTLPTYNIFPIQDGDIANHYGYIEFLGQEPQRSADLGFDIIRKGAESGSSLMYVAFDMGKAHSLAQEQSALAHALAHPSKRDYVLTNDAEYHRYSIECGMLLAISLLFKITDFHHENLIVKSLRPYAIDLEACFQSYVNSLEETLFFVSGYGALTEGSKKQCAISVLTIDGLESITTAFVPNKNVIYLMDETRTNLEQVGPFIPQALSGFKLALKSIQSNLESFTEWLDAPITQSMPLRVIPYQTASLQRAVNMLAGVENPADVFAEFVMPRYEKFKKTLVEPIEDGTLMPICAIFQIESLLSHLQLHNIPVFYGQFDSKILFDYTSTPVIVDYAEIFTKLGIEVLQDAIGDYILVGDDIRYQIPANSSEYFTRTPAEDIRHNLLSITDDAVVDDIISNADDYFRRVVRSYRNSSAAEEQRPGPSALNNRI